MNDNPKAQSGTGMLTRLHFSQLPLFFCSIVEVASQTLPPGLHRDFLAGLRVWRSPLLPLSAPELESCCCYYLHSTEYLSAVTQ